MKKNKRRGAFNCIVGSNDEMMLRIFLLSPARVVGVFLPLTGLPMGQPGSKKGQPDLAQERKARVSLLSPLGRPI